MGCRGRIGRIGAVFGPAAKYGGVLRALAFDSQRREALISRNVLDRMAELGLP